jgi:hypothetical protein
MSRADAHRAIFFCPVGGCETSQACFLAKRAILARSREELMRPTRASPSSLYIAEPLGMRILGRAQSVIDMLENPVPEPMKLRIVLFLVNVTVRPF